MLRARLGSGPSYVDAYLHHKLVTDTDGSVYLVVHNFGDNYFLTELDAEQLEALE